jgi:hypothetical protein
MSTTNGKREIPLRELDALRFEVLELQAQRLQLQLVQLTLQRDLHWRSVERRYKAKGYRLDLARRCLQAPEESS